MDEPIEQAKLSKKEGRDLLKIVHKGVWRSHLKTIGLDPDEALVLSWENIENLLALQLFLKAGWGKHSKVQFAQLRKQGREAVLKTLRRFEIPFELEKKKLIRRYQTRILPKREETTQEEGRGQRTEGRRSLASNSSSTPVRRYP